MGNKIFGVMFSYDAKLAINVLSFCISALYDILF